jgi:magnesium-transporting ATPase (P-type)
MASLWTRPDGQVAVFCKGAPEAVFSICTRLLTRNGEVPLTPEVREILRRVLEYVCTVYLPLSQARFSPGLRCYPRWRR